MTKQQIEAMSVDALRALFKKTNAEHVKHAEFLLDLKRALCAKQEIHKLEAAVTAAKAKQARGGVF